MKTGVRVTLALACAALAWWGATRLVAMRPPPERFVDVDAGGHRLHLCVAGDAGPVVVLESGLGAGLGFQYVRGPVSRFARTVAYDRAGYGGSDPGPLPRDAKQIVAELHAALVNANLPPPYVLVGHSMGGAYVRVFAATYPNEVRGIVLVDPARPESHESVDAVRTWFESNRPGEWATVEASCHLLPEGGAGMMASAAKRVETVIAPYPDAQRRAMRAEYWALVNSSPDRMSPSLSPGAQAELRAADETFRQAVSMHPLLPRVPTTLIVAGQQDEYSEVTASLTPTMREFHQAMKRWKIADSQRWVDATPGATLVVAQRSGHNIQTESPGVVIDAIKDVIERTRN